MSLLEARRIYKSYSKGGLLGNRDRVQVLRDVSLSLHEGECLGLLGESGSGKSTFGRIALGLERPDAGEILFEGRNLNQMRSGDYRLARRNLQVVFQNSLGSVNPRLRAWEIIAEPISNFEELSRKELQRRTGELLERVGLRSADGNKYPHQFSGGELQRICIARAISVTPRVIILDEAVSSLDMVVQARILDLLIDLRKELKISYLFISHDLRVVCRIADCVAVMDKGTIVDFARGAEKLQNLKHPAFKRLVASILPALPWSHKSNTVGSC